MERQNLLHDLERAERFLELGRPDAAIVVLRRVLSIDPAMADAHALLSVALLSKKRLVAAEHEAGQALVHDGESAFAHLAMAQVLLARRRLKRAEEHARQSLAFTATPQALLCLSEIQGRSGNRKAEHATLQEALERFPARPLVLAAASTAALEQDDKVQARELAEEALRLDAGSSDALRAMARVLLFEGDLVEARNVIMVLLQSDAADDANLHLLASLRAAESPFLGPWWRLATWMVARGELAETLILLGAFIVYRLVTTWAELNGFEAVASVVQMLWFGVVFYSWTAPIAFQRMIDKELREVELRSDF